MLIMVAGPYSAPTAERRAENLKGINAVAAQVLKRGHVPVVGLNAALPVLEGAEVEDAYGEIMRISLALAEHCDAILCIGTSEGVELEKEVFSRRALPIYRDLDQLPPR